MDLSSSSPLRLVTAAPKASTVAAKRPGFAFYGGDVQGLLASLQRPRGRLIVTPNLDHLRLLDLSAALRRAYRSADVVLNDSRFLDRLCLGGRVLTLPGSELAPMMLERAPVGAKVLVIGCDGAVKADLPARYPQLVFAFIEPSMGFIRRRAERRALLQAAIAEQPGLVFVCTGAPQSELLAAQMKRAGLKADILCCGSAFHFLTGTTKRAPVWARGLGGEWAWRFVREPRTRKRYLADALFLARNVLAFLSLRLSGRARFGRYEIG
ncbi:MAG TPA: WecB/TagA/CpsF family glycosyltransferase [Caulobacteraceae bacterium]|nr:WecB/TagA/CpsF family glycosyltransferase [Caulobacteraceae bacterium]